MSTDTLLWLYHNIARNRALRNTTMPKPSPLLPEEIVAVARPRMYEVVRFRGHNGNKNTRREFPCTVAGLQAAREFQNTLPRSVLFIVGENEISVPYTQAYPNENHR